MSRSTRAAVSDAVGNGSYTVTFNRSLMNCVVQAQTGIGNPSGSSTAFTSPSNVFMGLGGAAQVSVSFLNHEGTIVDSAFLITAFC